jgi:peroxiredoxin
LDFGTLKVAMKEVAAGKSSPPVELNALTLDGKPFSLAQSKGKNVVLAFWTSWSDRCTEQLAEFHKLQREYGSGALEIVGVSVDNDLKTARDAVDARSYTWSQAWLDGEHRAKATAAFDVNMLPGIFLIDPEGRVVGRDLEGDRLRAAVRRALQKK